jgi:endothelin-converting enzyme
MADGAQVRSDERTPLLGTGTNGGADGHNAAASSAEADDFAHLNHQVKSWRRRRWISLIASLFLVIGFVVILVLSGGKSIFLQSST